MKVAVEEIGACKRRLQVEEAPEVVRTAWEKAFNRVQREARPELFDRYFALADETSGLPVSGYTREGPMESLLRIANRAPLLEIWPRVGAEVVG